jgi:hypothetical protein
VLVLRVMTKFRFALLAALLSSGSLAQRPPGRMNDQRIVDLVGMGVSEQEIIRMISAADKFDFDLRPVSTDAMMNAGVSEELIKAMAARESAPAYATDAKGRVVMPSVQYQFAAPASVPVVPKPMPASRAAVAPPVVPQRIASETEVSVPLPPLAAPPAILPARPIPNAVFADQQVDSLIRQALSSRRSLGLRLNDIQESIFSTLACKTCAQSGYTITVYTPEEWIQLAARQARREMLPFSAGDVSPYTRMPLLHVNALPSMPDYLNGNGFSGASSVHRVVLTDTAGRVTVQPVDLSHNEIERNSAFRSASFGTAVAAFQMADVEALRASDPKGEFFIVVVGDKQNKYFKVKAKHFQTLFGTKTYQPPSALTASNAAGSVAGSR